MHKLKYIILSVVMILALITPMSVSGEGMLNDYDLPRVVDDADLLSDSEEDSLADEIRNLSEKYDFDIVIVTTDTLYGQSPMEYADDYFDYNGYGAGTNNDGILLLISMEDRDWWISTTGYGIDAFTDYGIELIGDKIVTDLGDGNYNLAFRTFLNLTDEFLAEAMEDTPYDVDHEYKTSFDYLLAVLIGFGTGLLIALAVVLTMKSKMKSVVYQNNANNYVVNDSLRIQRSNDIFLYKNVTKIKKPEPSDSSGSSVHSGSSGTSHGGGGGKF